jgi:hypothetical protein
LVVVVVVMVVVVMVAVDVCWPPPTITSIQMFRDVFFFTPRCVVAC